MKTLLPQDITNADRPFLTSRGNADGTVTLYYPGDTIPQLAGPTPAEIAAALAAQVQNWADEQAARSYAKLVALANMTPAQVQVWVAANVTNLTQAQDAIATLAVGLSVLARRI